MRLNGSRSQFWVWVLFRIAERIATTCPDASVSNTSTIFYPTDTEKANSVGWKPFTDEIPAKWQVAMVQYSQRYCWRFTSICKHLPTFRTILMLSSYGSSTQNCTSSSEISETIYQSTRCYTTEGLGSWREHQLVCCDVVVYSRKIKITKLHYTSHGLRTLQNTLYICTAYLLTIHDLLVI